MQTAVGTLATSGPPPILAPDGIQPVAVSTALALGGEVTATTEAGGGPGFRATRVSSASRFGWLGQLGVQHGNEATRLAVVENADATLAVEGGGWTRKGWQGKKLLMSSCKMSKTHKSSNSDCATHQYLVR